MTDKRYWQYHLYQNKYKEISEKAHRIWGKHSYNVGAFRPIDVSILLQNMHDAWEYFEEIPPVEQAIQLLSNLSAPYIFNCSAALYQNEFAFYHRNYLNGKIGFESESLICNFYRVGNEVDLSGWHKGWGRLTGQPLRLGYPTTDLRRDVTFYDDAVKRMCLDIDINFMSSIDVNSTHYSIDISGSSLRIELTKIFNGINPEWMLTSPEIVNSLTLNSLEQPLTYGLSLWDSNHIDYKIFSSGLLPKNKIIFKIPDNDQLTYAFRPYIPITPDHCEGGFVSACISKFLRSSSTFYGNVIVTGKDF